MSSHPSATAIHMNRVAVLPSSRYVLTTPKGLDFDQDAKREFITRFRAPGTLWGGRFEFYECTADNSFALVHVLDLGDSGDDQVSYAPADVGDGDGDGLSELLLLGRTANPFYLRLYESETPYAYPSEPKWVERGASSWQLAARIAETDGDEKQEIIAGGHWFDTEERIVVFENDGDDSYHLTYTSIVPGDPVGQSLAVLNDFDGDGKNEIVWGGIGPQSVIAYESTGDDAYAISWTWKFNPLINVAFIVDAGDLDGDGKKEILVGGRKPNSPAVSHLHIFEAVGDNQFEDVATLVHSNGDVYSTAAVADVDGDGHREIIFGTHNNVAIYKNTGDNAWQEVWNGAGSEIESIGAGDHDGDGKDEIIFRGGSISNGNTGVWEISPADAADMDADGKVDVIDNCPTQSNPGQEDADGDAVGNACDNCAYGPNPAQGPAPFGQTIVAADKQKFSWPSAANIVYVRGDLALVSSYAVQVIDSLLLATSLTDTAVPAGGAGFWYLVKPDCPVGSWQSELGAEPGRDVVLP